MIFAHYFEAKRHARQDYRAGDGATSVRTLGDPHRRAEGRAGARGRGPPGRAPHRRRGASRRSCDAQRCCGPRRAGRPRLLRVPARPRHLPSRNRLKFPSSAGPRPRPGWRSRRAAEGARRRATTCRSSAEPLRSGAIGISGPRAARPRRRTGPRHPGRRRCTRPRTSWSPPSPRRARARDWDWLKWLPHTDSPHSPIEARHLASSGPGCVGLLTELEELLKLDARGGRAGRGRSGPRRATSSHRASRPTGRSCFSSSRTTRPSSAAAWSSWPSAAGRTGSIVLWVAPATVALPAACRTFLESAVGGGRRRRGLRRGGGRCALPVDGGQRRGGRSEPPGPRLTPPSSTRACPVEDDSDLPRSVSFLSLVGPELAEPAAGRRRALGREPVDPHRSLRRRRRCARPKPGNAARPRRPVAAGHVLDRPARRRAARPRRRHDRRRQVRAAPGLDPRHGRGPLAAAADLPARRLQGRLGVPRLRQPAAHRRPGHRPLAAPGAARPRVAVGRAAPPRAHPGPAQGQGPRRARAPRRGRGPAEPGHRRRRVRRPGAGGARVRRRRRQRRPARPLARPAPHPRHAAPGRRHQGQPARQHQPAHGPADGRRGRQRGRARDARRRPTSTRPCPGVPCPSRARAGSTPFQTGYAGGWTSDAPPRPELQVETLEFGSGIAVGAAASRSQPGEVRRRPRPDRHPADRHADRRGARPRRRDPAAPQAVAARAGPGLRPCGAAHRAGATTSSSSGSATTPTARPSRSSASGPTSRATSRSTGVSGSGKSALPALHRRGGRLHGPRWALPGLRPRLRQPRPGHARVAAARRQRHLRR